MLKLLHKHDKILYISHLLCILDNIRLSQDVNTLSLLDLVKCATATALNGVFLWIKT
jgi:hypothetical protein